MINRNAYSIDFLGYSQFIFALVTVYACCGLFLPGEIIAQDKPTGDGFQLQQTLNQLLGEQADAAALNEALLFLSGLE